MKNVLLFTLLIGISLTSCSQYTQVREVDSVNTTVNSSATAMENEVLVLINQYRATKRLSTLKMNTVVTDVARNHSSNMATKKVPFSHEGFDGRAKAIEGKLTYVRNIGENVAYGQITAKEVVQDWLSSPGHKKNIEGNFTETGIGIFSNSKGVLYYTQIFIR